MIPNAVLTVANIAKLRSLTVPAQFGAINVLGYNSANDGGEGIFNITTVNPGADNGGTIIWSNTAGYYFVRQYIGPIQAYWFGIVAGTGISGANRTANSAAIQAAISAAQMANNDVDLGPGTIEFSTTLTGLNGVNVAGRGNVGESTGSVFKATQLSWFGSGLAIDLRGTGVSVDTRIQCCWSQFTLNAINNTSGTAQGIAAAWNQRSIPLLDNVTVTSFPDWGLDLSGQQWNVSFRNLRLDGCGHSVSDSCGLNVGAAAFMADVIFENLQVEGCGTSGSTAGGIKWIVVNLSCRGIYFTGGTIIEGNNGTDEAYFTNTNDLHIDKLYNERLAHTGQACCIEFNNCIGGIHGGYMTGEDTSININAIQIKNLSEITVENVTFNTWAKPVLVDGSSALHTGDNWWAVINTSLVAADFDIAAGARCNGIIKPSVMINKGGTNQTGVASTVATKVTFNTIRIDLTKSFSTSNDGLILPRTPGAYNITAMVKFLAAVANTRIILWIYRNGSPLVLNTIEASGTGEQSISISTMYTVASPSDYFEVFVRQDSGVSQTISGDTSETWFTMTKV